MPYLQEENWVNRCENYVQRSFSAKKVPINELYFYVISNIVARQERVTFFMCWILHLNITGFECRCGGLFCGLHRYSDKHDCTFNYKELGQEQIRKNNPVVVGAKIQKI